MTDTQEIANHAGEVVKVTGDVGHPTLAAALAAFQAEVPTIKKANTATVASQKGSYQYAYADLSDVTERALPLLGKHGLAWTTRPTLVFGPDGSQAFVLEYALKHSLTDEALEGTYPLPNPLETNAQGLGAALTYARRYLLCAVTGVAPGGDDDDAHSAGDVPAQTPRRQASSQPRREQRRDPQRSTPDEPIDMPKPSRDWTGPALSATSYEQLKEVYDEADRLGELGLAISGDGETVAQMLVRRRGFLKAQAEKQESEPAQQPKPEPEPGPERNWVSEARGAETRAQLSELVSAAVAAGVDRGVLDQMTSFEDALPTDPVPTGDGWYAPAAGPLAKKGDGDAA